MRRHRPGRWGPHTVGLMAANRILAKCDCPDASNSCGTCARPNGADRAEFPPLGGRRACFHLPGTGGRLRNAGLSGKTEWNCKLSTRRARRTTEEHGEAFLVGHVAANPRASVFLLHSMSAHMAAIGTAPCRSVALRALRIKFLQQDEALDLRPWPSAWPATMPISAKCDCPGGSAEVPGKASKWNRRCTPMGMGRSPARAFRAEPSRPRLTSSAAALGPAHPCASVVHVFLLALPHVAPCPRAFSSRCAARPHAPEKLPGPPPPVVSRSGQRDDGETHPGLGRRDNSI